MSLAVAVQGALGIVGEALGCGGDATVTRPHTLTAADGFAVAALELAADAALGATALSLRLPGAATGLGGSLPAGCRLTIAATTYTTAADAAAGGNLLAVTLTTGLVAGASTGAAVAVAGGVWSLADCVRHDPVVATSPAAVGDPVVSAELVVPIAGAGTYVPRAGDLVTDHAGVTRPVLTLGESVGFTYLLRLGSYSGGVRV